jgi:hypothetical protein
MLASDYARKFKRQDNFFQWFSRTKQECDVCGVYLTLSAIIPMVKPVPIWQSGVIVGWETDNSQLCEACLSNLVENQ